MEMPFEVKETLNQLEKIVKDIHFRHMEAAKREAEPYINHIISINNLYPKPILITDLQLMNFVKVSGD